MECPGDGKAAAKIGEADAGRETKKGISDVNDVTVEGDVRDYKAETVSPLRVIICVALLYDFSRLKEAQRLYLGEYLLPSYPAASSLKATVH